MYKIVNIADLKISSNMIDSDRILEFSNDRTKLYVADNDHDFKTNSYLLNCIDILTNARESYIDAIIDIKTTYLTSDISNTYMPIGCLINSSIVEKIMSSNAFLTKDGCKKLETECISYINELKNKAVSFLMAQMNESFIAQNSVGRIAYGQILDSTDGASVGYVQTLLNYTIPENDNYDFESGEFSLANLLFNRNNFNVSVTPTGVKSNFITDAWKDNYNEIAKSYFPQFPDATLDDLFNDTEISTDLTFNAFIDNSTSTFDYRIHVPMASYDFKKKATIPIAKLIEYFLKKQIKKVIKTVCDTYISKMTSVPTIVSPNENNS